MRLGRFLHPTTQTHSHRHTGTQAHTRTLVFLSFFPLWSLCLEDDRFFFFPPWARCFLRPLSELLLEELDDDESLEEEEETLDERSRLWWWRW